MQNPFRSNAFETSRTYPLGAEEVRRALEATVRGLPRWKLGGSSVEGVTAVRRTRSGFKDDVSVRLTEGKTGAHTNTHADIKSASRLGVYDFGQNRRNIQELLDAVDRELRSGSAP